MKRKIPVSAPLFLGKEKEYVVDCMDTTWISSIGTYVKRFENNFAEFCGVSCAVSCSSGTAALHIALLAAGVGPGDEVIIPDLTFVATANAVTYCGAKPVPVDVDSETWNISPESVSGAVTPRTKAVIAVHLFGLPAEMDELKALCSADNLLLLGDAAEAHGAQYKGRKAGSLAKAGTFSFYGNKIITTGEGGMVTTDDEDFAERLRRLKGQGLEPSRPYYHPEIGFNYRMTNIQAAIGTAQLENIDEHLRLRMDTARKYREILSDTEGVLFQSVPEHAEHAWWMVGIVLDESVNKKTEQVRLELSEEGIETRPFFIPMHSLPPYADAEQPCPNASFLGKRGIVLPTGGGLSPEDIEYVCDRLSNAIQ